MARSERDSLDAIGLPTLERTFAVNMNLCCLSKLPDQTHVQQMSCVGEQAGGYSFDSLAEWQVCDPKCFVSSQAVEERDSYADRNLYVKSLIQGMKLGQD